MTDSTFLGNPVAIGSINRQLQQLWDNPGGALSRASLVNFAVYCKGAEAMRQNTRLLAELMHDHACRALLIGTVPAATSEAGATPLGEPTRVEAWINAHCRSTKGAAKQVCCEQISFLIEGDAEGLIPNIVFSHLDSDLPLYLWWQGDFTDICGRAAECKIGQPGQSAENCQVAAEILATRDCQAGSDLWHWVDRLFFDSLEFSDPRRQFCYLKSCILRRSSAGREPSPSTSAASGNGKIVPCDLNWGRSLGLRQGLAQVFEAPECLSLLPSLERVRLAHAPGFRTTALLFAGWLASQLGAKLAIDEADGSARIVEATSRLFSRESVLLELIEHPGVPLNDLGLFFSSVPGTGSETAVPCILFHQELGFAYWHADITRADGTEQHHLFPAGESDTLSLLDEELMLAGQHRVYLKALAAAEPLL